MSNNTILIILVALVLCYSFFSATETAFSCANRIKIKTLARNGDKKAGVCIKLYDQYSKLLTTVLVGNTIVNVVAATLATVYFVNIYNSKGATISSIVMTLVIMIIGEIIPKNLASSYPEKFAITITPVINLIMIIFTPLTFIFKSLEKLFKVKKEDNDDIQEEFLTMVEEAVEENDIEKHEADIISNAIEFNDIDVGEIYTPRTDVVAIDIDNDSIEDIEELFRQSGFSRLPVYKESMDNIIGVLLEKDFYYHFYCKKDINDIKEILTKALYTTHQVKSLSLLKEFQLSKSHLAVVVDEYGGTDGIVTLEDILEELVGEIYDEHDLIEEFVNKVDDNTYIVKGDFELDKFFDYFNIKEEEELEYNTLSALIIDKFDRIPQPKETIIYNNISIEVLKTDNKKILSVKISTKI